MNDLEQRLRHTLHELADTVPESEHAKAGFERRRAAARGLRRPALVAAAAVAVLAGAGIAIPLAMRADEPPPAAEKKGGLVWSKDYDWLPADSGPYVIGRFTRDGEGIDVVAWVRAGQVCVAEGHHVKVGMPTDHTPGALTNTSCVAVPEWPVGPGPGSYVMSRSVLYTGNKPETGPVPGMLLFLTAPKVEILEVRKGDGSPVVPKRYRTPEGVNLFVADFEAPDTWGFGYTARDANGAVIEEAIT